jgi:SET domain-containing protein
MQLKLPDAHVKETGTAKGRGVFASRKFKKGELVEECAVVVVRAQLSDLPLELQRVVYDWEFLAKVRRSLAFALGFGSLYNHDDPANMRYEADREKRTLRFITVREIDADEELTINYSAEGGGTEGNDNDWFERMKVKLISGSAPRRAKKS